MTDLGDLSYFLGISVTRTLSSMVLSHDSMPSTFFSVLACLTVIHALHRLTRV
jgi:hypothetical protein